MRASLTVFVPVKKVSRRLPGKNTKPFAGFDEGLTELKIRQLSKMKMASEIIISTNDEVVVGMVHRLKEELKDVRLKVVIRPEPLCQDDTNADDLIQYAGRIMSTDLIMWAHVTSPMVQGDMYDMAVVSWMAFEEEHDSLISGHWFKNFLLNGQGNVVNNPTELAWPRTQELSHYFEPNHAMFLSHVDLNRVSRKRVGTKPYLYEMDKLSCIDVDTIEDFNTAQTLYKSVYGEGLVR